MAGGSRASTPTSPLEAGAVFDELPTYLIDVLEEMGDDAVRRCYWDMGPWSDLLRVWRPLGVPASRVTFKVGSDALAPALAARVDVTLPPSPCVRVRAWVLFLVLYAVVTPTV